MPSTPLQSSTFRNSCDVVRSGGSKILSIGESSGYTAPLLQTVCQIEGRRWAANSRVRCHERGQAGKKTLRTMPKAKGTTWWLLLTRTGRGIQHRQCHDRSMCAARRASHGRIASPHTYRSGGITRPDLPQRYVLLIRHHARRDSTGRSKTLSRKSTIHSHCIISKLHSLDSTMILTHNSSMRSLTFLECNIL